jgi:hypothetical protein
MGASIEDITAKLEAAAADKTTETPTEVETETVVATDDEAKGTKKTGAQDRIQELVAARKDAERKYEELSAKFSDKESELSKLIDMVQDREQDARVVAKINELHSDPKFRDIVETLDKAIRGIEVEVKATEKAADAAPQPNVDLLKNVQAELDRAREEASFAARDQKSDLLLMKSDLVLEKLFEQLPEAEYTAEDRKILNSALADMIDWDSIEATPATLEGEVAKGFQKAVDWYGNPKGAIASEATESNKNATGAKSKAAVDLSKLDLGKMEKVTVNGKDATRPAINDDDFSQLLAEELRRSRGGR